MNEWVIMWKVSFKWDRLITCQSRRKVTAGLRSSWEGVRSNLEQGLWLLQYSVSSPHKLEGVVLSGLCPTSDFKAQIRIVLGQSTFCIINITRESTASAPPLCSPVHTPSFFFRVEPNSSSWGWDYALPFKFTSSVLWTVRERLVGSLLIHLALPFGVNDALTSNQELQLFATKISLCLIRRYRFV